MENIDSFYEYMLLGAAEFEAQQLQQMDCDPPAERCLPFSEYIAAQERDLLYYGV